jgi:prepilin-type processing-associated H-X9-DG protein
MRTNPTNAPRCARRGLTIAETLVAIACLGILIPLLAASGAARPNRERMCAYRLGKLGSAMLMYTIEHAGSLPGSPGTSGAGLILDYAGTPGSAVDIPGPLTQTWDWAGPLTGYLGVVPHANRAKRAEQYRLGKFWCPSNNIVSYPYAEGSVGPVGDWNVVRMVSYNSVRNLLLFGDDAPAIPGLGGREKWSSAIGLAIEFPDNYAPKLSMLGNPAGKVFLSDGSRFTFNGMVDHDIGLLAAAGGMYSDGGPTLQEVYLRSFRFDLPDKSFSYRHSHGSDFGLNAVFYDGHVAWMSEATTRHPKWWFPPGTSIPWGEMNRDARMQVLDEIDLLTGRYNVP